MLVRPGIRRASFAVAALSLGCGVQNAAVAPASPAAVAVARESRAPPGTRRFVARPGRSHITVRAGDVVTGRHVIRVGRSRMMLATSPAFAISVDAEMESIHTDAAVEDYLKDELLEVSRFPRARLLASLEPIGEEGEVRAKGTIEIHGVVRGIELDATLVRQGEGYRFRTTFYLTRRDFGVRRDDIADGLIDADMMVHIDAIATPERVVVEELDADQ